MLLFSNKLSNEIKSRKKIVFTEYKENENQEQSAMLLKSSHFCINKVLS